MEHHMLNIEEEKCIKLIKCLRGNIEYRKTCVGMVVHTGMTGMVLTVLCSFHICTWFLCQGAAKELRDKDNVWMVCVCVTV